MNIPVSFEFFPPRTAQGRKNLQHTIKAFKAFEPEYMSVTFGAGGSTQEGTYNAVMDIQNAGVQACPHLSCIGSSKAELKAILGKYQAQGIKQVVALRGDLPSGNRGFGELHYASDLVHFIREEFGDTFAIRVAAYPETHPQAKNFYEDFGYFKQKIKAGADMAITQYFYNSDAYYQFLEECSKQGITTPVVPGIMPITNYVQLSRFSNMCGAEIPRWIATRLESYGDNMDDIRKFGVEIVTELCEDVIRMGAPALHFYSMNKAEPSVEIMQNIRGITS